MRTVHTARPLDLNSDAILTDALRRIAEADELQAALMRYGPTTPAADWIELPDTRQVTAAEAEQHLNHLMTTAELLTGIAAAHNHRTGG